MSGIPHPAPRPALGPVLRPALRLWRQFRQLPVSVALSAVVLTVLVLMALFAPLLATHDWTQQQLLSRLSPPGGPGSKHVLGADHLGRDVYSRMLFALRTTLVISVLGVCIGVVVGALVGLLAGLLRGWVDNIIMLIVDANTAIPLTLLAMAAAAVIGSSPMMLILIVGLADFGSYVRIVRAEVMSIRQRPFVEAARALGASRIRVARLHVLPGLISPLIVLATINFSHLVVLESALSFLGVGVQPPNTSLGQMVGEGRSYLITQSWLAAIPATVIVCVTLTIATLGDHLRDVLTPDHRR